MYDWNKIYEDAIALLDNPKNEIDKIETLPYMLGVSISSFYEHFPADSVEMEDIKARITRNRAMLCEHQRKMWRASDNPTLQVAAYKLTATKEERDILNMTKQQIDVSAEKPFVLVDYETKPE